MNALKRLLRRPRKPRLSLVVVIYDMAEQARKTLQSLSPPYQRGVNTNDYEILLLENASPRPLGRAAAEACGDNIRYFYREETLPSPVPSARFGVAQARGDWLALMIDGARMASPGLVAALLDGSRLHPDTVIAVPSYHLGRVVQQEAVKDGYNEAEEHRLLQSQRRQRFFSTQRREQLPVPVAPDLGSGGRLRPGIYRDRRRPGQSRPVPAGVRPERDPPGHHPG